MKTITQLKGLPIKLWLDDIEDGALKQAQNLAELPFAFKHIAIMPDSHLGYGSPIGAVVATKGVVVVNIVGVDIGCGLCAVKTSLKSIDKKTLKNIMGKIRKVIPVGFNKHKEEQDENLMPQMSATFESPEDLADNSEEKLKENYPIVTREYNNALKSLGSLGGGNHFCEIQKGDDGHIWIMIHSGSRNLGLQVATHYNKLAKELNKKWCSIVPAKWDLAFLPIDSKDGKDYLKEMQYCVDYAYANRKLMMDRVLDCFAEEFNCGAYEVVNKSETLSEDNYIINIAHSYAKMENHFKQNVIVHRKGATLADFNTVGIIPGSQGSSSYIVRGLGNRESFNSCSHGAGRVMGRKQAKKELSVELEKKKLDDLGVIHSIRSENDLDEAPSAYKDIQAVMDNQKDLVDILVKLTPLAVIKG